MDLLTTPSLPEVALDDRYRLEEGRALLSGVQAVVRLAMDQRRRDLEAGLNTGGFITGYPGSPLAGLDLELTRRTDLLADLSIVHRPALNEELAATAVAGSQLSLGQPDHTKDGVFAIWYGKAPGLDRASDAFRHGNLMGTGPHSGVVVCVGDDPQAKSSSVPSSSEPTLFALAMPILTPADPQEILELGLHGFALSRASGLWVGLRIPATVADSTQSVEFSAARERPIPPDLDFNGAPFTHQVSAQLLGAKLIELESSLYGARLEIARRYGIANALNRVTARSEGDTLGIVAAGSTYLEVLRALKRIGISQSDLAPAGVRLLKISMPYPLDEDLVREFATGLDEIMVVEDKRPFVETLLKSALCGEANAPRVVGKHDQAGRALVPFTGEVVANTLAPLLADRIQRHRDVSAVGEWRSRARPVTIAPLPIARGAYFCSGCPHNTSVKVPDGTYVGSGSGCHGLAIQMSPRQVGNVVGRFQMGGEGAMWNGMSPFVTTPHFVQNIGDGTLAHSGSLAIRAAVDSKVNITFKLLVNSTVAMTGGQPIAGGRGVADTTRLLLAEGVKRIIITTDDPRREATKGLPASVEVWPRRRIIEAQKLLATIPGVTVLMHDQECAAELRRKRKRGLVREPREHVLVNTRLCEACGDCGAKSNCLSLRSVETPYGRKTQIDQDSCNFDFSCLEGDCPAFVTVRLNMKRGSRRLPMDVDLTRLVQPPQHFTSDHFTMRLTGIGGTGVLTVAQIVAMAAHLQGRYIRELDQTGIAQKGGAVVSDLCISDRALETTPRLGDGECNLYLGCDLLVAAASQNLDVAEVSATIAVVSTSPVPTGRQVADPLIASPSLETMRQRIDGRSRPAHNVWLDAQRLAHDELGANTYANILLLGAAFQSGALPLSVEAIERAIELNGVAVEDNLRAFRLGRLQVVAYLDSLGPVTTHDSAGLTNDSNALTVVQSDGGQQDNDFESLITTRVIDLIEYQGPTYARRYTDVLERARDAEAGLGPADGPFSAAVAVELHRLMAYKDEYEVARLQLSQSARAEIEHEFGAGRVTYHLTPPVLRTFGLDRKFHLRSSARMTFHLLRRMRRLRGTKLDPFGRSRYRRQERLVRDNYMAMIEQLSVELTTNNHARAVELAKLPTMIRGFGEIKARNIQRYKEQLNSLLVSS
ncbi:MAG: indolepyruvate ferredoxin oxidoreductase family protein [Acidimicrobiales bacterium]